MGFFPDKRSLYPKGFQTTVLARARPGDLILGLPLGPQGLSLGFFPPNLCHCRRRLARPPFHSPRPLRPTKRRSLNLATWFFMTAEALRSSAE